MRTYKIKAIYLEVTSKCNLHCPHCYNDSNQKNNEEMDKNKISRIIEQCRINEVENISFSGGEPFLWDSLLYSLNKAKESNFSSISIVSNGTIVTNNLIKSILDIVERESFFVQLSLDGSSPKEHDAIRGIGAYDKLLKTVAILYQNNINYYFHSVLHNRNYNSIKNMIALAKKLNAKKIDFSMLKKMGRATKSFNDIGLSLEQQLKVYSDFDNLKNDPFCNVPRIYYGKCPIFNTETNDLIDISIRIDVNGNVYACQNFNLKEFALGNIFDKDLKNIITYNNILELKNKIQCHMIKTQKCSNCFLKMHCNGGCPAIEICSNPSNDYTIDCQVRRQMMKSLIRKVLCDV